MAKRKRWLAGVLSGLMLLGCLAGCGEPKPAAGTGSPAPES